MKYFVQLFSKFQVENFKLTQKVETALHSKFNHVSGDGTCEDDHHLQLDIVALFVLYLMQMTASGLQIIYNTDEVSFIQNLIYYLERSYRFVRFLIFPTRRNILFYVIKIKVPFMPKKYIYTNQCPSFNL